VGVATASSYNSTGVYEGASIGYCQDASYLSQCYYNADITGSLPSVGNGTGSANAVGLTTAGMKYKSTYVGWDFSEVWDIEEGVTYPFLRPLSGNANLSTLSVSGHSIAPTFNADSTDYTLTVPCSVTSITINATKADTKAQGVSGTGTKSNLQVGSDNIFDITVTAEDGSQKI
jgi:hypothetical protein